jgi:hypothetical protein
LDAFIRSLQQVWWLILTLIGVFVWTTSMAIKIHSLLRRLDYHEKRLMEERQDVSMLLRAQFATLDGLKQMNCNGSVVKMYDEMRKYVLEKH